MAVLFWIFLDQICPKWIKLDQIGFLTNQIITFTSKQLLFWTQTSPVICKRLGSARKAGISLV